MKILTNFNFNQNEIQNAAIQRLASPPSSPAPVKGQLYFDTSINILFYYSGSRWVSSGGDVESLGTTIHGATAKDTPVDNDLLALADSVDSNKVKKLSWEKLKTALSSVFSASSHTHGSISNAGAIGTTKDLIVKTGTNGAITTLAKGTAGQFLQYDGSWGTPPNKTYDVFNDTTDGLVPKSTTPNEVDFLRKDGSWATPPNQTYSTFTKTTDGLVPMAGENTGKYLKGDGTWATPPNTNTTYGAGNGLTLTSTTFSLTAPTDDLTPSSTNAAASSGHTHKIASTSSLTTSAQNSEFPTAKAVKDYADGLLGANDAMVFKGTVGTGGTYTIANFNSLVTYEAGWTYKVVTAGIIKGATCEIGDMLISTVDRLSGGGVNGDWVVVQANIDGAVTGPATATAGNLAAFSGGSGRTIVDSGINASSFTRKVTAALGGSTSQEITHNLNTRDLVVTIRETSSPWEIVYADVVFNDLNKLTVKFATAPSSNQYTITIVG